MNFDALARPVSWALLQTVWQGTLVALGLRIALGALHHCTARARYAAACVALLIVALLPLLNVAGTLIHLNDGESLAAIPSTISADHASVTRSGRRALTSFSAEPTSLVARARAAFESSSSTLVLLLWLGGVLALSLRQLADWKRVRGLARRGVRPLTGAAEATVNRLIIRFGLARRLRVLQSARVDVPALIGWLRPVVLVPVSAVTGLPPRQFEALVVHELVHLRRHDYLVNLFQIGAETLLFFHPAVWWISRRVRIERELCCDDDAVAICGDRVLYARALATMEGLRATPPRPALAADGGVLVDRIRRLVRPDALEGRSRTGPWFTGMLASAVLALSVLLPMLSAQPVAETPPSGPATGPLLAADPTPSSSGATVPSPDTRAIEAPPSSTSSIAPAPEADLVTASPLAPAQMAEAQEEQVEQPDEVAGGQETVEGRWSARFRGDELELTLKTGGFWNRHTLQTTLNRSELTPGRDGYRLRYDAGTFVLLGMTDTGGSRTGTFRFVPSSHYLRTMKQLGYDSPSPRQQLQLAMHNVDTPMLEELKRAAGEAPALDSVLKLAAHGIEADYARGMRQSGLGELEVDEIVRFRVHGIDPDYVRGMVASGYRDLTADGIVRLRVHGIPPDYMKGIVEAGYGDEPIDRTIRLRNHGISPRYLADLRDSGFRALTIDEVVKLRNHGIPPEYVSGMVEAGFDRISPDELVELRTHGIPPEYVSGMAQAGFDRISPDELVALRTNGIPPEYVSGMVEAGFERITPEELVELRTHGIPPQYAGDLYRLGYGTRTIQDLVSLRVGGVDADYVRSFERAGMTGLPVRDVLRLRTHGIDGRYAAELKGAGARFDTVDELIQMRTRGVDGRTVRRAVEAGVDPTADHLVEFQVRGGRSDRLY